MSTPGLHRSAGSPDGLVDTLDGVVDRGWDHTAAEQVSAALEGAGPEAAMRIAAHLQIDLELSRFACEQPSAALLAAMLSEGHGTREVTKGVAGRRSLYAFAAAVCLAVAVPLWLFAATPQASTVGHLIALSDDATWSGTEYRPGDVVKEGQSLRLTSGTAGFVLEKGTRIELIAPAVLQVERSSRVRLRRGAIAARVPEQDIGFSVSTEDGQIVDLGTEFFVEYDVTAGTRVAVAEGQVKAAVFNSDGSQREFVRLTAGRVAQMDRLAETISEVGWAISWDDFAEKVRRSRAGVASIGGVVRIASQAPEVLTELSRQTIDHVVLFTEERGAASAESGIEIEDVRGRRTIAAGSVFDSYLVHFDPGEYSKRPAIGAVTFERPVLAVLYTPDDLRRFDSAVADGVKFSSAEYRGLEPGPDDDIVSVSEDRRTVSFNLRQSMPNFMDQFRILVDASGDDRDVSPPARAADSVF